MAVTDSLDRPLPREMGGGKPHHHLWGFEEHDLRSLPGENWTLSTKRHGMAPFALGNRFSEVRSTTASNAAANKDDGGDLIRAGGDALTAAFKYSHYAASRSTPTPIYGHTRPTQPLVVSFSYKHTRGGAGHCGGGYIKLVQEASSDSAAETDASHFQPIDPESAGGDTPFWIMLGPDQCDGKTTFHITFGAQLTGTSSRNIRWKLEDDFTAMLLTNKDRQTGRRHSKAAAYGERWWNLGIMHTYTLALWPDGTYSVYVDQEVVPGLDRRRMEDDWDFSQRMFMDDTADKQPDSWVTEAEIDDPSDTKPADWDERKEVPVPGASPPWNWDEKKQGQWVPPMMHNPHYRGKWTPRRIQNPAYKGPWIPMQKPNLDLDPNWPVGAPKFPVSRILIDIYERDAGAYFDDIVVADSLRETWDIIEDNVKTTFEIEKRYHQLTASEETNDDEL